MNPAVLQFHSSCLKLVLSAWLGSGKEPGQKLNKGSSPPPSLGLHMPLIIPGSGCFPHPKLHGIPLLLGFGEHHRRMEMLWCCFGLALIRSWLPSLTWDGNCIISHACPIPLLHPGSLQQEKNI